jgi:hypothetical protein
MILHGHLISGAWPSTITNSMERFSFEDFCYPNSDEQPSSHTPTKRARVQVWKLEVVEIREDILFTGRKLRAVGGQTIVRVAAKNG